MKLGLGVAAGPDPDELALLAAEAASLGYVSIWSNDHPGGDGLAQLSAWAANRDAIDLGVGVLALDRHQPSEIAGRVRELALPQERLILGLGAGWTNHPLATVRAGVEVLRGLLPGVRLAVAAMGPKMCLLAGEIGDVALLNWMTPERAAWGRELVLEGARAAGKESVPVTGYVRVAVGAGARERLAVEATHYTQMPHYGRHFEAMGGDPATVGVAAEDPGTLPAQLAAYSALDVAVVRVLSERNVESVLHVARHAIRATPG